MTSLFHFEDKVHRRSLPRDESLRLVFPRLLCQVLEHIGFLAEPRIKRRRGCEATLTIDRWRARPRAFHLPPLGSYEDEPDDDSPRRDLSPLVEHTGEPPTPVSPVFPPVSSAPQATHGAVRTFSATTASFAASQATLAKRMTRTEASIAQI